MNCREASKYIYAHADGELDAHEHADAVEHLDACPDCGAKVRAQRGLKAGIARALAGENAPADLRARILGTIAADHAIAPGEVQGGIRTGVFRLWYPLAAAAMVALVFVGIYNLDRNGRKPTIQATFVADFTDESEPACNLADRVYAVHAERTRMGEAAHDPSLPRDGLEAAEQMRRKLQYPMLRCSTLDGRPDTTFISAGYCQLEDCQGRRITGGQLVYRFDDGTYLSMISVPHLKELKRLHATHKGDRDYYILKPHAADQTHPITVTVFNCPKASHLVCVEYPPTETIDVVEPMSAVYKDAMAGLRFEPVLAAR